jgi:VIT1/CCC1 family predicted Fe2+/Mn2+ transporter
MTIESDKNLLLQKIQPGLLGLMDGSISTLAPIFAVASKTHKPEDALITGLATCLGAGISMGIGEALSDDGIVSGRGKPIVRGVITGGATAFGGILHTLPFLVSNINTALFIAYIVVVIELILIVYIKHRFMQSPLLKTIVQVVGGGIITIAIGLSLGAS